MHILLLFMHNYHRISRYFNNRNSSKLTYYLKRHNFFIATVVTKKYYTISTEILSNVTVLHSRTIIFQSHFKGH